MQEAFFRRVRISALSRFVSGSRHSGLLFLIEHESIRKERQREGIDRAKVAGIYRGRKATIDPKAVQTLRSQGVSPTEIAKQLKIGRASVYRALAG